MLICVSPASAVPVTIVTPGVSWMKSAAVSAPVFSSVSAEKTVIEAGTSESVSLTRRAVTMISPSPSSAAAWANAGVAAKSAAVVASKAVLVVRMISLPDFAFQTSGLAPLM